MFKENYKKANDAVKLEGAARERIEKTLLEREAARSKPSFRKNWLAAIAASIAIVLALGIMFFPISAESRTMLSGIKIGMKYSEVYECVRPTREGGSLFERLFGAFSDANYSNSTGGVSSSAMESMGTTGAKDEGSLPSDVSDSTDFSGTNVQIEGVDEADVIKTDGNYFYVVKPNYGIKIISVSGAEMREVGEIIKAEGDDIFVESKGDTGSSSQNKSDASNSYSAPNSTGKENSVCEQYKTFLEIYVSGNRLAVISEITYYSSYEDNKAYYDGYAWGYYYSYSRVETVVELYDITDRSNPIEVASLSQDGYYTSSRMTEGNIYILSNYYVNLGEVEKNDRSTYIPTVSENGDSSLVSEGDICGIANGYVNSYVVLASLSIKGDGKLLSSKAVLGNGYTMYADDGYILVSSDDYKSYTDESGYQIGGNCTDIICFELKDGAAEVRTSGTIDGTLYGQFAIDRDGDYFRFATTVNNYKSGVYEDGKSQFYGISERTNALFVTDLDLKVVGTLMGYGNDEQIKAVRFSGDIAYVVTFRQTDPLFAFDLSEPTAPKIISALKVPGFSQYLQSYGTGRLFGFGSDADETSGGVTGLKISMYNVADNTNITEFASAVINGSYSPAQYNHKAIFASSAKNIIGFYSSGDESYRLYTFDEEAEMFKELGKIENLSSYFYDVYCYQISYRGMYIGDWFYVVGTNGASAIRINDLFIEGTTSQNITSIKY